MQLPKRLLSIDALRALTMFLMIFVNDVDGVSAIPEWIKHAPAAADAMGFADIIFPAFLFIVGLSLPFAIRNRLKRGDSQWMITQHILGRSAALVIMGFLHVNLENYSSAALLPAPVWEIGITIAFFLIWLDYRCSRKKKYLFQAMGWALLVVLALLYKGGSPDAPKGLEPYWWGILGIIGWAYLVVALLFLYARGRMAVLVIAWLLLLGINITKHTIGIPFKIWVIGDASSPALVLAGTLVMVLYQRIMQKDREKMLWPLFLSLALGCLLAGFFIRPFTEGISKIRATTSWILLCIGIALLSFVVMIWLVDLKKKDGWIRPIWAAGTSTLTCYLIPYILYPVYTLTHFSFPPLLNSGGGGIIRSLLTAFVVIRIGRVLEHFHLRLKV